MSKQRPTEECTKASGAFGELDFVTRAPNSVSEAVGEDLVLVDIENDKWFSLNGTARFVWENMDTAISIQELVAMCVGRFNTTNETASVEVLAFLERLNRMGLVEVHRRGRGQ